MGKKLGLKEFVENKFDLDNWNFYFDEINHLYSNHDEEFIIFQKWNEKAEKYVKEVLEESEWFVIATEKYKDRNDRNELWRQYDYHETIEGYEVEDFSFDVVQYEDSDNVSSLTNEMEEDGESEEAISDALFGSEYIIITHEWSTRVPERCYDLFIKEVEKDN